MKVKTQVMDNDFLTFSNELYLRDLALKWLSETNKHPVSVKVKLLVEWEQEGNGSTDVELLLTQTYSEEKLIDIWDAWCDEQDLMPLCAEEMLLKSDKVNLNLRQKDFVKRFIMAWDQTQDRKNKETSHV
jgi:hypothetical protein